MPVASPEADLPDEIGAGADQPVHDPLGREVFDLLEVEFVGQVGVEVVPDQLVDGQGMEVIWDCWCVMTKRLVNQVGRWLGFDPARPDRSTPIR